MCVPDIVYAIYPDNIWKLRIFHSLRVSIDAVDEREFCQIVL